MNKKRIYYFSHLILFVTGTAYILDLIMGGKLSELFALNPVLIFQKLEWWRIFTYPLAKSSIESTILFIITFFIFAPKIEEIYQQWLYPFIIVLLINIQGIVLTFMLWNSDTIISGMEGISVFILTLFALINIRKRLIILNRFYLHTGLFILGMLATWISIIFVHSYLTNYYPLLFGGIYSGIFGLSVGTTAYLQIRYTKNPKQQKQETNPEKSRIPKQDDFSLSLVSNTTSKRIQQKIKDEYKKISENNFNRKNDDLNQPYLNVSEEKLNEILDKANAYGFDSLTFEDKKYLDYYSKQI